MKKGVTPVITAMLLTALFVGMATATYYFLAEQQGQITGQTEKPELSTVNITCSQGQVTWWIRNSAPYGVSSTADILFERDGSIDTSVSRRDVSTPPSLQNGEEIGEFTITPAQPLTRGQRYDIEASFSDASVRTTCVVGEPWWNSNWKYRRAINYPASMDAQFDLNTSRLIANEKMRSDCEDIRVVQDRTVLPYDVTDSECGTGDTTILFQRNTASTPYVYYGHLFASPSQSTLSGDPSSATLQEEERINLPG